MKKENKERQYYYTYIAFTEEYYSVDSCEATVLAANETEALEKVKKMIQREGYKLLRVDEDKL